MLRPEEFVATKTSRRCHGRWVKRPQSWLLACPRGNFPQPTNGSIWVAVSSPSWQSITGGDWSSANLCWLVNDPAFRKLLRERLIEMQNNYLLQFPQTFRSLHHLSVESSRGLFRLRICWWKVLPTQLRIRIQYSAVPPNKKWIKRSCYWSKKKSHYLDPCPLTLLTSFASGTLGSPSWGGQLAIVGWKVMPIN